MTTPPEPPGPVGPLPEFVVFDTNVWSSGRFNAGMFEARAARLGKAGIGVLVPEVVLWEWASHSTQDAKSGVDSWRRLSKAGLVPEQFPGPRDHVEVLERLTAFITTIPNARIVPVSGDAAIAGLRDQVLQTGPGSTKQTVKTGAADSAWVRDVLDVVENDTAKVVFVSGDVKGIERTCEQLGARSPRIVSERALFSTLFAFDTAPAAVIRIVADSLLTQYETALAADDGHSPPAEAWIPVTQFHYLSTVVGLEDLFSGEDITIDPDPTLIGIRGVEVVDSDEGNPQEATVRFVVVLLGNLTVWGHDLDADGRVETTTTTSWDRLIEAPMIGEFRDRTLYDLTSDGPANVSDPERRFPDGQEARYWLADELTAFTGLTVHALRTDGSPGDVSEDPGLLLVEEDELMLKSPSGRAVTVTLSGDDWDDWDADFGSDGFEAQVVCRYDPGVRVWAGRDSVDAEEPFYTASADSAHSPEPFTALGEIWRYLYAGGPG